MTIVNSTQARDILNLTLRNKFNTFTRATFNTVDPGAQYLHNWHIDCMSEALVACQKRDIKRLIINVPPRYLKSISVSVAWPAYLMGINPSERILAASYSQILSTKHSLDCRLVMQSEWYKHAFPDTLLAKDQNEKMRFETTAKGHRVATSVGGTATGQGGDFLIVDDPHNPLQAASEVQRTAAIDWFDQTFMSRLNNKKNGVVVVVMQRLHDEDLSGHLLKKSGWEHLCLPAIAEKKTFIQIGNFKKTREVGHILHEEREGVEQLAQTKVDLGTYGFSGQYQQQPVPSSGGMFQKDWFIKYLHAPEGGRIYQSWDTAYKAKQINDPSVCTTWLETNNKYYLLDVVCERLEYPALKKKIILEASRWSPEAVLIEDKASGQSLLQELRKETLLPVIAIMPEGDKVTRASAVSATIEAGKVAIPENSMWVDDYMTEMITFPLASHDDRVDSTTQFLSWIKKKGANRPRIRSL